jgi:hypothetical protein
MNTLSVFKVVYEDGKIEEFHLATPSEAFPLMDRRQITMNSIDPLHAALSDGGEIVKWDLYDTTDGKAESLVSIGAEPCAAIQHLAMTEGGAEGLYVMFQAAQRGLKMADPYDDTPFDKSDRRRSIRRSRPALSGRRYRREELRQR